MLRWELHHPTAGHIILERGYAEEFRTIDPNWPEAASNKKKDNNHRNNEAPPGASLLQRAKTGMDAWDQALRVVVNGEVRGRYQGTPNKLTLKPQTPSSNGKPGIAPTVAPGEAHLALTFTPFSELLVVAYKHGTKEYVELDNPAHSRAAAYREALNTSPSKRILFPLFLGFGKALWYISFLILAPLIGKLVQWILEHKPDFSLPTLLTPPSIDLPVPTLNLTLPALPTPPHINLPVPQWTIPWPEIGEIPGWLEFLIDHNKAWLPIFIGIWLAVMAVRNSKRSERRRQELANRTSEAETVEPDCHEGNER